LRVSTIIQLSAVCTDMIGKPATFTIRDADDDSAVITTLRGTCGKDSVTTTWTMPSRGPPGQFVFEVTADGNRQPQAY